MGLSKLINKVNKAKSAINSLKGISSKLQSLNYNSVTDQLGEEARKAQEILKNQRNRDTSHLAVNDKRLVAKALPKAETKELMYPMFDELDNYIVFSMRARNKQTGKSIDFDNPLKTVDKDTLRIQTTSITNDASLFSEGGKEILLYIPSDFSSTTNAGYTTANFGVGARQMDSFIENFKDKGLVDAVGEVGAGQLLSQGFTSFLNGLSGGIKNVREGRAKNPMTESLFEGVSFREWNFEYEFWPKTQQEAEMVKYIIYTFRTAMLPDTFGETVSVTGKKTLQANEDENYFNHPNIFDVYFEGEIANQIDGFLPMVLTKCDVSHFNNGNNTTFGSGSAPISQKMSLSFQEIKMLTQESYQEISAMYGGSKSKTGSPLTSMNTFAAEDGRTVGTEGGG